MLQLYPEHYVDYPGHIQPKCSLYCGELLRIDAQERQTYIEHILRWLIKVYDIH